MTALLDGSLVCTDPGVGVLAPGWHGQNQQTPAEGPAAPPPPPEAPPGEDEGDCPSFGTEALLDLSNGAAGCLKEAFSFAQELKVLIDALRAIKNLQAILRQTREDVASGNQSNTTITATLLPNFSWQKTSLTQPLPL